MKLVAVILVLLLTVSGAQAQKLSGMGANIYGNYFNFTKANLEKAPISVIEVGSLQVRLQKTRLVDVQKKFGGTIMTAGESRWLCYHTDDANTWFLSNPLGGYEFVMMVASEASKRKPADCEAAPEDFAIPDYGIPGLGASTSDLKAAFGAAAGSKIAYRADRPGGYADIAQYIGYVLSGSKVTGIGVGETSVPTVH